MAASSATQTKKQASDHQQLTYFQVVRETVESLAIAFVLALLFKAFIAEAFVIPTGSMAPTLMGAHKDVRCEECGYQYQCSASSEFDQDTGERNNASVVGTTCPLCRKPQAINPRIVNHATFSGDRILVSKLAYVFSKPRRWDVIVFKFIEKARLNYIKRCVGRPNETIRIRDGDIFVQTTTDSNAPSPSNDGLRDLSRFEIARKPPHVLNAMLQPLFDSKYIPKSLVAAGWPNQWQPFPKDQSKWTVKQTPDQWSASISGAAPGSTNWIRYYHRVVDPIAWEYLERNKSLPKIASPESYRLITDFTAYNDYYLSNSRDSDNPSAAISQSHRYGSYHSSNPVENDGLHWLGDLAVEIDVKTELNTKYLTLMLVESGAEHECKIDLASGIATAQVKLNGSVVDAFVDNKTLVPTATAKTSVRAGGQHTIRFANVDDSLVLWIDGKTVNWSPSGWMDTEAYLPFTVRRPMTTPGNPLDAAPIAIGVEEGGAIVSRAKAFRDIYYISHSYPHSLFDYHDPSTALKESVTPDALANYVAENHGITPKQYLEKSSTDALNRNAVASDANLWGRSFMTKGKRIVDFSMKSDWYFPMGDNSGASSDARSWLLHHTPERLLIGRAVMVFWPHYWNAPIPFIPNVQRMGLIR